MESSSRWLLYNQNFCKLAIFTLPYGCFQKEWYPVLPSSINKLGFSIINCHKPSILGYPYFWKHPILSQVFSNWFSSQITRQIIPLSFPAIDFHLGDWDKNFHGSHESMKCLKLFMVPQQKKHLLLERYVLNNDLDMIYRFGVDF